MIWIFLTAVLLLIVYNSDFRNFMLWASKVSLVLVLFLGMIGAIIYYDTSGTEELGEDVKEQLKELFQPPPEEFEFVNPYKMPGDTNPPPKGFEYISPFEEEDK